MDTSNTIWRPVIDHELRHELGIAGAEHDLGAAAFLDLALRYVLGRLGRLPADYALDSDERYITRNWNTGHSTLELEACAKTPLPAPRAIPGLKAPPAESPSLPSDAWSARGAQLQAPASGQNAPGSTSERDDEDG